MPITPLEDILLNTSRNALPVRPAQFPLSPLAGLIRYLTVVPLLWSGYSLAGDVDGTTVSLIDNDQAYQAWNVVNGGVFNVINSDAESISTLGSTVNLSGATIGSRGPAGTGLNNQGSALTVDNSVIFGTAAGMRVTSTLAGPSTAVIRNSQITGGAGGINVAESDLTLINSQVTATAANGNGLSSSGGTIMLIDSQIKGGNFGITVIRPANNGISVVDLDKTSVEGGTGAAINVFNRGLTTSVINIRNGSTLVGGNGVILDVNGSSKVQANVSNSDLTGNIIVHAPIAGFGDALLDLNMNSASLTGDVDAQDGSVANLALTNGSLLSGNFNLAGASTGSLSLGSGSQMTGSVNLADTTAAQVSLATSSLLLGDINLIDASSATLNLDNGSQMTGSVNLAGTSSAQVSLANAGHLLGDLNLNDASSATLSLDSGSQMTGSVNLAGTSSAQVSLANAGQLLGDLSLNDASSATLNLDSGSQMTGSVKLADTSTAQVTLANGSQLTGDVIAAAGTTANVTLDSGSLLTGRLENLQSLSINNNAQWQMLEDSTVDTLSLNGGRVRFGEATDFQTLNVGDLSGNGTFVMDVDFASGDRDFLNVTGNASGNHELLIASTGTDPVSDTSLHVVHINAGDATFGLVGGAVDLGTWSYGLRGEGTDWYLDASQKTISPGTASVLALFNTAPTVWYGELSSLRSRMGELRSNSSQTGAWSRVYGAKYDVSANNGLSYSQQQNGFSIGADAPLPVGDGQWLLGVLAGHSDSDLSLARGSSGTVKSYYAGVYTTWLDAQSGYYFDGVLKFNRFNNDSKVNLSDGTRTKGSYDNNALGASAEFGKHIKLDDGYFVEPSAQLATVFIQGRDYSLDNDMQASGERTRSLLGKLGATAGRRFDLGEGRYAQPYVRAAYVHEFAKGNEVSVNGNSFNNDLSGSRGELGAGLSVAIADKWDVHADFQYTDGEKLSQPWGANVGVRYSW
jgi:outer membrane autotransporter protein